VRQMALQILTKCSPGTVENPGGSGQQHLALLAERP
jgi:hypothetical protein